MTTVTKTKRYWWLAINGASCAASLIDFPSTVRVSPVPEQMIGYQRQEEQQEAHHFLLNAPIDDVTEYKESMPARIRRGEVAYLRPENPEAPTLGPTLWITEPHGDEDLSTIVDGTSRFNALKQILKQT